MTYKLLNKLIDIHLMQLEKRLESLICDEIRRSEANLRCELVEINKQLQHNKKS